MKYIKRKHTLFLMSLVLLLHCYADGHNIFLTSIPKTGTHLLMKCLKLITGKAFFYIDNGHSVIERDINNIKESQILQGHLVANSQNITLLEQNNYRGFLMIRDPRGQVYSRERWAHNRRSWDKFYARKYFKQSPEELIFSLINEQCHICITTRHDKSLRGTDDFYRKAYLPWQEKSYMHTVRFERLIGPKGGGSRDDQINEIIAIARHIDVDISQERAEEIADQLFGVRLITFRAGQIDEWKDHFTQEHKQAFKQEAGQLLIDLGYEEHNDW